MGVSLRIFFLSIISMQDACIRARNIEYVQKGIANYTQGDMITSIPSMRDSSMRDVVARFSHPHALDVDLDPLKMDWPLEERDNRTFFYKAQIMYSDLFVDKWMNIMYTTETTDMDQFTSYTERQYKMYSSPIKMFFMTVILPSASFIVFFLFIVFYTGTPDSSNIPYESLNNDKISNQV